MTDTTAFDRELDELDAFAAAIARGEAPIPVRITASVNDDLSPIPAPVPPDPNRVRPPYIQAALAWRAEHEAWRQREREKWSRFRAAADDAKKQQTKDAARIRARDRMRLKRQSLAEKAGILRQGRTRLGDLTPHERADHRRAKEREKKQRQRLRHKIELNPLFGKF